MIWVKKRPKITCFWVILSFSREKITHEKDEAQTNIHVKENGITVNSTSQSPQERHGTLKTRAGGLNSVRGMNQPLFFKKNYRMPYAKCRKQWKSFFQKRNFLLKFRPDTTDPPKNMWKITTFEKIRPLPHFVILPWWVIITKEARSKVDCHCCFVINRFRNRCWRLNFFGGSALSTKHFLSFNFFLVMKFFSRSNFAYGSPILQVKLNISSFVGFPTITFLLWCMYPSLVPLCDPWTVVFLIWLVRGKTCLTPCAHHSQKEKNSLNVLFSKSKRAVSTIIISHNARTGTRGKQ